MRSVLLDTDVFSFLFKGDTRAAVYERDLQGVQVCLSFQSVAELRYWSIIKRWGDSRRSSLEAALARCVLLPYDDGLSRAWAQITAHRRQLGRPIECGDAWIAATALRHGIPLITHNAADYRDVPALGLVTHA
jgi:tRNA(fMet)-specific endonuclease VapC